MFQYRIAFAIVALFAPVALFAGIVAAPIETFEVEDGRQPLRLPTAIATNHNDVYVLDGAHNRIVIFDSAGGVAGELRGLGGETFNQPVGLRVTADGRIWVCDGPNHRVLVGTRDGVLERTIDVPPGDDNRPADPTDIAVVADGTAAWIVDNENHRLMLFDFARESWTAVGRLGAALGQFEYPWQVAVLPKGDIVVSDVINARAQLLNARGEAILGIASFGVESGQLFRPSGVAISPAGEIWIADSVIGVVQVFRNDATFVDVLRGDDGQPLRLDGPLGIAFDDAGAFFVVETRANRVRKFSIQSAPQNAVEMQRPPRALPQTGQQSKACTLCHIDWLAPFSEGRDSSLMPRPNTSRDDPVVARADMCISCHDGTVSDSRLRVWDQHGHQTGIKPPDSITVPPHLPLVNGTLACRTCHSAHGSDAPQGDFRRAMLLRVPNQASELCMSCHVDKTRGPRFGTHPTGGMPWPVPEKLIEAGAKVGPNPRELTCQVCHTPHGAKNDHLLVLGTSSNQLCVNCHDQIRPGMFRDGAHAEHPLTAQVNAEQAAAVHKLGTKLGPNDRLICLSCHKLHHGHGERFLLADDLTDGQMCLQCHSQRREMFGSPHDLRKSFPDERNRLGLTPTEGGPCSSCHLFHRFARQPAPAPGDANGQCTTCHQAGQCAEKKKLGDVNHPSMFCTDCHNPHETRYGKFLKAEPVDLCVSCHIDQSTVIGGPHDAVMARDAWCQPGQAPIGPCLGCHRPHGDGESGLFRVTPAAGLNRSDGACVACHPSTDPARQAALALLHPTAPGQLAVASGLPLVAHGEDAAAIGCKTCHNPHSGWGSNEKLLRVGSADTEMLCTSCHSDKKSIVSTAHSAAAMAAHRMDSGACRPCHSVHGDATLVSADKLWPAEIRGHGPTLHNDGKTVQSDDAYCTGCHRTGGAAPTPRIATHPNVKMLGLVATGNGLPLFDAEGRADAQGLVTCRTCHTPHGHDDGEALTANTDVSIVSARRTQLRAFEPPNTCTNCHGTEALWRFLYFHDPSRRAGPVLGAR